MRSDLVLTWMSEVGSGDVHDLRKRITWMAHTEGHDPDRYEVGRWLRDLSSLGHVEVDWDGRRWAIAPAAGAILPLCGGTAVLAGSRRPGLVEQLETQDVSVYAEVPPLPEGSCLAAPATVYVQADSIEDLEAAFAEVGVRYVGCAARHLADTLPPLQLGQSAVAPAWDTPIESLVISNGLKFREGLPPDGDVLCRISVHGGAKYLYRRGQRWFHTNHAHGISWALAERRLEVFRWRGERTESNDEVGTLFVDQKMALPTLQSRALVLCSGQTAQAGGTPGTATYRNVPRSIAEKVAISLRQTISIIE